MRVLPTVALLVLAGSATLLSATPTGASCKLPDFAVIWSYPAQDQHDVPVNTQIWLLTSVGANLGARWTLNGASVAPELDLNGLVLRPALLPNTAYTFHMERDVQPGEDAGGSFDLSFTTGTNSAVAPELPMVQGYEAVQGAYGDEGNCAPAIAAQDCFDTGQDTLLRFSASAPGVLAWLVNIEPGNAYPFGLMPAGCGAPTLFTHARSAVDTCFRVRAIGAGGQVSAGKQACTAAADPDAGTLPPAPVGAGPVTDSAADAGDASSATAGPLVTSPTRQNSPDAGGCSLVNHTNSGPSVPMLGLVITGLCAWGRRRIRSVPGPHFQLRRR